VRPDDRVRAFRYHCKARIGQQNGQPVPGGAGRHDPVLSALHDQDRDGNAGNVSTEVFPPRDRAAQRRGRGHPDGGVEAVLPRLVADPAAAEQVEVVVPVQVRLDSRRAVGGEFNEEIVVDAPVSPVRVGGGPGQERRQRCQQRRGADPPLPVGCQVAGHFPGSGTAAGEHRAPQVQFFQQHVQVGGKRVVVIAGAGPAGGAAAAPVIGDDAVPGTEQGRLLLLPGAPVGQVAVDQDDGRARPVVLVMDPDVSGVLPADRDIRHHEPAFRRRQRATSMP